MSLEIRNAMYLEKEEEAVIHFEFLWAVANMLSGGRTGRQPSSVRLASWPEAKTLFASLPSLATLRRGLSSQRPGDRGPASVVATF